MDRKKSHMAKHICLRDKRAQQLVYYEFILPEKITMKQKKRNDGDFLLDHLRHDFMQTSQAKDFMKATEYIRI